MIKKMAMVVVGVVTVLIVIGFALPRTWRVERSIRIEAPPERVLPFVANLRRWQDWSVWTKVVDPKAMHTFVGPDEGVGARWQWSGPVLGHGAMTITAADRTGVSVDQAIESETVNARSRIGVSEDGTFTLVTWQDEGTLPPMGGFFLGQVEALLTQKIESGLRGLKELVERQPPPQALPPPSSLQGVDAGAAPTP